MRSAINLNKSRTPCPVKSLCRCFTCPLCHAYHIVPANNYIKTGLVGVVRVASLFLKVFINNPITHASKYNFMDSAKLVCQSYRPNHKHQISPAGHQAAHQQQPHKLPEHPFFGVPVEVT